MSNTYFSDAGVDDALSGESDVYISLHSASPGTTGANEITGGTYARVATTWSAAAASSRAGSAVVINVPAGVTITHFGIYTLGTAGVYKRGGQLSAPETYGAAGTYTLTPTLTGSG
jgi:hypothetical protein